MYLGNYTATLTVPLFGQISLTLAHSIVKIVRLILKRAMIAPTTRSTHQGKYNFLALVINESNTRNVTNDR